MKVPPKRQWRVAASSGDPAARRRRQLRDSVDGGGDGEAVVRDRSRRGRDARRARDLLGRTSRRRNIASRPRSTARRGPLLPHAPWRGRTGRLRLPAGRGAVRSLDQRGLAGRARAGDRRDQSLRSRRRRLGARGGSARRAGPRRRESSRRREHYGRLRRRAVSARRADRLGRGVRNRILGASLRRRRDLSRDGPHRDRRRSKRQFLVALDDEPLFSPDRA